jgi:hypothetical protein
MCEGTAVIECVRVIDKSYKIISRFGGGGDECISLSRGAVVAEV